MRVGDIILNHGVSEDNPVRHSVFLRWRGAGKSQGGEAVCVALVNGAMRTVCWDKYAVRHSGRFEVVGNIPVLKILREGLNDAKKRSGTAQSRMKESRKSHSNSSDSTA